MDRPRLNDPSGELNGVFVGPTERNKPADCAEMRNSRSPLEQYRLSTGFAMIHGNDSIPTVRSNNSALRRFLYS